MKKNDIVTLKIDDFSHDGRGVAHHENMAVFIEKAIKGEVADIKIIKVLPKKNMALGVISEIKKKSPHRVNPKCEYKNCGGCQLHHMTYEKEIEFKKEVVNSALRKLGGLNIQADEIIKAENIYHYRSKVSVPVGKIKGKVITGFYAKKSHNIIDIDKCMVQPPLNDMILKTIRDWAQKYKIPIYNEETKQGKLRHIVIKNGDNEIMVILVSKSKRINDTKKLVETLKKFNKKITSIILNVNPLSGNNIMGEKNILLYGKETITSTISDIKFNIGPNTFFQINKEQTSILYEKAVALAEITPDDTVIDAYCGVGTLTLFTAKKSKKSIGFEINEQSVKNALLNAKRNKIENVEFISGDVNKNLENWVNKGNNFDILILDPPRKGATNQFWDLVNKISPKKIIYISCYPSTLARDLKYLAQFDYTPKKVIAVDMFPRTHHIETITLIEKSSS